MPLLPASSLSAYAWLDAPMWVFDLDRRAFAWANPAGLTLWGAASIEELRARDHSDMSETAITRNRAAMAEHRMGRSTWAQWTIYPHGAPLTVEAHARGIQMEDGRQAILYEARTLPQSLEPSALRGVEALRHTTVRIALHRRDGSLVLRNPSAIRAFGALADAPSDALSAMFLDPTEAQEVRRVALAGGEYSKEVQLHTLDGPRWHGLDVRMVPDPVSGRRIFQLNARDIQALKEAQQALRTARDEAEQAARAKGRFLATMSHEIRTPLNGVLGMIYLLQQSTLDPTQHSYVQTAAATADTLHAIINDILDYSKIEGGMLELEQIPIDLTALVGDIVRTHAPQAEGHALSLTAAIGEGVPPRILGDPNRLRQVLHNLVGNALKFTPSGEIRVTVALVEAGPGAPDRHRIELSVSDTGIGISPEAQRRIFEPFSQADDTVTRRFGGTGLGLAICKRLTDAMGDGLQLDSTPGQGSRFWFQMDVEADHTAARTEASAPTIAGEGRRVLLVDDNEINRRVGSGILRTLGFTVDTAADGEDALDHLRDEHVIVLMDVEMPGMDGFTATAHMRGSGRAGGPERPIIAMTAHGMFGDRERCLEAGMDDYVPKPIRVAELSAVLSRWLT